MSQKTSAKRNGIEDNEFSYLLQKVEGTQLRQEPFEHLEIKDFLKQEHFNHITNLDTIQTVGENDEDLIQTIKNEGYEKVSFPGTFDTVDDYISYRKGELENHKYDTNETAGIVFRLAQYDDPLLNDLFEIFNSIEFLGRVCSKFDISTSEFEFSNKKSEREKYGLDTGLQKYLDGYEISPHPDTRKKALTWMLNLNPGQDSEQRNYHTHYLKFKDEKKYIKEYWKHNTSQDRCWVPWDWCETIKQQTKNNSIVIFSPCDDGLHAIKADYEHYETQRTQLYGNLWYENYGCDPGPSHDDFIIENPEE
jgi:hypothetical protein